MITGIYKFTNLINDKVYIGSSKNIENRLSEHVKYKRGSKILYKALLKYTMDNFKFEIIEECDMTLFITKLEFYNYLFKREQFYLDQYYAQEFILSKGKDNRFRKITYNINPLAEGSRGSLQNKPTNPESIKKQHTTKLINGGMKILVGVDKDNNLQGPYFGFADCALKLKTTSGSVCRNYKNNWKTKNLMLRTFKDNDELMMEEEDIVYLQKLGYELEYLDN